MRRKVPGKEEPSGGVWGPAARRPFMPVTALPVTCCGRMLTPRSIQGGPWRDSTAAAYNRVYLVSIAINESRPR